jgi:hypothetical protein
VIDVMVRADERVMSVGAMPMSSSAARNVRTLSSVCMPVSTSVGVAGPDQVDVDDRRAHRQRQESCTTPSAISRVLALSRMLLDSCSCTAKVTRSLTRHAFTVPSSTMAVIGDLRLADAVDRGGGSGDGQADRVLDGAGRRARDVIVFSTMALPPWTARSAVRHIGLVGAPDARYGRRYGEPAAVVLALLLPGLASAAPPDPSGTGRYAVGVTTLTVTDTSRGRTLVTEVWYPATTSGRDTAPARGRFPLVLLAHGSCGFRTNYEYVTEPLASFGFVVAAPDLPGMTRADCVGGLPQGNYLVDSPLDLSFLRRTFAVVAGPLATHVRTRRAGLVGSSLGGAAVMNAAIADTHFPAVVGLSALATAPKGEAFVGLRPRRAVLAFGGTNDRLLPPRTSPCPSSRRCLRRASSS